MKRALAISLVAVLALGVSPLISNAAVKAGATCKREGQVSKKAGKEYTCIKKGKKLVWSKGVTIKTAAPAATRSPTPSGPTPTESPTPRPSPSPDPTPTPTPTPTPKSLIERWNSVDPIALSIFNEWGTKPLANQHTVRMEFVLSNKADRAAVEEVKKRYDIAARFWAPYSNVANELKILVANHNEAKWICDYKQSWLQIRQDDCEEIESNGRPDIPTAGQSQVRNRNIDMYMIKNLAEMDTRFFFGRVEHEFTHNIFYHQSQNYQNFMPCWQIEGGAEYFGILMATRNNPELFIKLRNFKQSTEWMQLNERSWTLDDWVKFLNEIDRSDIPNRQGDGCLPVRPKIYHHTILANEFLVYKLGIPGYLNIIREAEKLTWVGAIKKVFGTEKQVFYREMAQYMMDQFRLIQVNRWSFEELFKIPEGR